MTCLDHNRDGCGGCWLDELDEREREIELSELLDVLDGAPARTRRHAIAWLRQLGDSYATGIADTLERFGANSTNETR